MQRIVIVGTTGSGKTTLAGRLSRILDSPHIELDALHWESNWVEVSDDIFRDRVTEATAADRWIVDGNYGVIRGIVWPRADAIVWLDYTLREILWRLVRRTALRVTRSETCCNGNRESILRTFSADSILLWALRTHARRRQEFPILLAERAAAGATILIHKSPAETEAWINELETECTGARWIVSQSPGNMNPTSEG